MSTENPCRYCPDHGVNPYCHGSCEKHLKWKQAREEENKAKRLYAERYKETYASNKRMEKNLRRDPYRTFKRFSG